MPTKIFTSNKRSRFKYNQPPDRWIPCPRRSTGLIGTSKTFLDDKYDETLPRSSYFKPSMINSVEKSLDIKVGLVVDLNNSKRFYDPTFFDSIGIAHTKIACTGVDGVPSDDQVSVFIRIIKQFLEKCSNKKIVVHCTHGYNRTGYMIIAYLVTDQGWDLETALSHFAQQRSPGIYKPDYIREIISRFSDPSKKVNFLPPALPDWCIHGKQKKLDHSVQQSFVPNFDTSAKFPLNDSLITVTSGTEAAELKAEISGFFGIFPGCQPVSLSRESLSLLSDQPYMVSWKADGSRNRTMTYMVDREFNIFHVPHLTFPSGQNSDHVSYTLLDGEFVFENDHGIKRPRFLIFDMMVLSGELLTLSFDQRLCLVDKKIIKPRDEAFASGTLNRLKEAFSVRTKPFFDKSKTKDLFERYMKRVTHETDGLLFQPKDDPYCTGTCSKVLKWKPDNLNTVDFYLNIQSIRRPGCLDEYEGHLYVLHKEGYFAKIRIIPALRKYNRKIIECAFDKATKGWKFLRVREDKVTPNAYKTAMSVCDTILHPVDITDIYKALDNASKSTHTEPLS